MRKFIVGYDEWGIPVEADTEEQAKLEAFRKFRNAWSGTVTEEEFLNNIRDIREL